MSLKPSRVKNQQAVEAAKRPICEVCFQPTHGIGPHHVISRGAGGPDCAYNLIQLCADCHYGAIPSAKLSRAELFQIIALREGITVERIEFEIKRARGRA